ncbi:MAG: CDP-alcohol phosphatidyltransferase family protein [FCB group bacterium]|nr:CDP-alcohol phosphatidyltransferase family protein [FCB group bacterium]
MMYEKIIKDKHVIRRSDTDAFFTPANMISLLRILLTVPALWLFHKDHWGWGMVILGVCIVTDWLDGYVARKTRKVSDFGKVLDPFADKVVAIGMMILMVMKMDFPIYFIIILVLRDLSISIIGNILYQRHHIVGGANIFGKIFILFLTVSGVLWIVEYYLQVHLYAHVLLYITLGFMILSWIVYIAHNLIMLKDKKDTD